MTFPDQPSIKSTIEELKDVVIRAQGEDHEATKLVSQIEAILYEIESKMRPGGEVIGASAQLASGQHPSLQVNVIAPQVMPTIITA